MMLNGVKLPVQDLSWIDLFDSVLYQGLTMVFLWCNIFRVVLPASVQSYRDLESESYRSEPFILYQGDHI